MTIKAELERTIAEVHKRRAQIIEAEKKLYEDMEKKRREQEKQVERLRKLEWELRRDFEKSVRELEVQKIKAEQLEHQVSDRLQKERAAEFQKLEIERQKTLRPKAAA